MDFRYQLSVKLKFVNNIVKFYFLVRIKGLFFKIYINF